ncbi:MAG: peptidase U32 family protein [Spirochaetota bacterium]|nr:peptidase U32 family protein [Spirochaetota bacterium]
MPLHNNEITEIVSPAGNPEKLRFAIEFGADAVYFGGQKFNLRDKSINLKLNEIEEGIKLCKKRSVRSIFLVNSFLRESDIDEARELINDVKDMKPDVYVVSDPGMILLLKEANIEASIHLSTQMSTLNHLSIKFWNDLGIERIVLARETTLEEIKRIREYTDAQIEIFTHGALCVSYSGRCLLSRFLSGRDANQGDCSHPCRWNYSLIEEKRPGNYLDIIEHASGTEILASKDLCLISKLPEYLELRVNALKIEGRMKSIYYTANTTRIYKHALRAFERGDDHNKYLPFYLNELDLINHRPYTDDLFNEFENMGFSKLPYINKALFLGYKLSDGKDNTQIYVKTFNPIYSKEEIEAIFPIEDFVKDDKFYVEEILEDEKIVDMAEPGRVYLIKFNKEVDNYAIFRRRKEC